MPIDTSIYNNIQTPDFAGSLEKGMRLGDMMNQRSQQQAQREAYQRNTTVNPDGTVKVNRQGLVGDLYRGVNPQAGMEAEDRFAKQDKMKAEGTLEQLKAARENFKSTADMLSATGDQDSWTRSRNALIQTGISKADQIPEQYDPKARDYFQGLTLTGKDRLDQVWKEKEAERAQSNSDRDFGLKKSEAGVKRLGESRGMATELRKERSQLPTTKTTQDVAAAYNRIQSAASNPTAAGDLSLIFNYMKILDPGSTVREGEFANAQNATGVPDRILNTYEQIRKGNRLNDEQRRDFMNHAKGLYTAQTDIQKQVDSKFKGIAAKNGVDPNDVLIDFNANEPAQGQAPGAQSQQPGYNLGPNKAQAAPDYHAMPDSQLMSPENIRAFNAARGIK